MDANIASTISAATRTSTDAATCPSRGSTLSHFFFTNFSLFLSPPPCVTKFTNISFTSMAFPPSAFHVCVRGGRQTVITDGGGDGEDKDGDIGLKDLSKKLQEFAEARDWEKYHTPRNLLLAMVGEVGELSEIFQWKGEVKRGLEDWEESEKEHLGEELSDVLLYLIRLADSCDIDLAQASLNKILKNAIKYPLPPLDHSSPGNNHQPCT